MSIIKHGGSGDLWVKNSTAFHAEGNWGFWWFRTWNWDREIQSHRYWFVHHGIKEDLYFSLFSSPVWLILYGYCKEKFCLGHSWELKAWYPLWFRSDLSNNFLGNFFWQHSWTFKETIRIAVFQEGSGMFAKVREDGSLRTYWRIDKKQPGQETHCNLNTRSLTLISRIPFKPTLLTFAFDDF